MPGFRLFMTVLVARPAEPLEYAIMAAAVIAMGLVSAITVMMALADSVYIAGPAPLGNFDPVFYTGPFESLEPQASWLSLYTSVRSGVEGLFAPLLASYSWVILLFYSVTSGILLHPVLSKIRSQLPFAFYRT
ncbi:MAG: hypothetical protein LRS43_01780, partial [Desulfurococcales archaeon]|nr:hypothetical protein [Desulfurococcales archaeon]